VNDIETILSNAGRPDGHGSDPAVVDADVVRGRRALTVRRMRRTGTRSVLVGALAIGSFAVVQNQSGHDKAGTTAAGPTQTVTAPAAITTTKAAITAKPAVVKPLAIKLVAYTGAQPEGYTVDSVPSGWELQGVNNYNLDIAPVGFADQDLSSFEGKIVVMLLSNDAKPLTAAEGNTVAVGDGTGIVSNFDRKDGLQLSYKDAVSGKEVMVQAPLSLHWTDAQLGQFAAGVHVSASAEAGNG
jgi:hypothetical protein